MRHPLTSPLPTLLDSSLISLVLSDAAWAQVSRPALRDGLVEDSDAPLPEPERLPRGSYVALTAGLMVGGATDEDGQTQGSYFGNAFHLRLGEEIFDGLSLGIEMGGGGGSSDTYSAGLGGLFFQVGLRPLRDEAPGLLVLLGTGIGGGSITPEDGDDGPEGGNGGMVTMAGVVYELDLAGAEREGFALAPAALIYWMPPQNDNETMLNAVTLGVSGVWYGGARR